MEPKDVERLVMAILNFLDEKVDGEAYPVVDGALKLTKSIVPMLLALLLHDGPQASGMSDAEFAAITSVLAKYDASASA